MWILWFYVILAVGMPEHAFKVGEPYTSEDACNEAKLRIWAAMDDAYPLKEQILYRFACKPAARIIATPLEPHENIM